MQADMVGSKGRGKASTSKSKYENLAPVPAVSEPLNVEQSADGPLDVEEKNNEILYKEVESVGEERDDTFDGLVVDDEFEEKLLPVDDRNNEGKDAVNELNKDHIDNSSTGVTKVDTETMIDGGDAANKADAEGIEETAKGEGPEEVSHGGATDVNVEGNGVKTNEAVPEEGKEPINDNLVCSDTVTGEEQRIIKVAAEGKMVINEDLAASEHKITDDIMINGVENEGQANKLQDDEPRASLADKGELECARDDAIAANNINAAPKNPDKPKRKLVKKKVVKKKMVLKKDVASMNETGPHSSTGNGASGEANLVETNDHIKNDEKAEVKQAVKVYKKPNKLNKKVSKRDAGVADSANSEQKSKPANDELGNEEHMETNEQEVKDAEVAKSEDRVSRLKKKKKKVTKKDTSNVAAGDINKLGPSQKSKSTKKVDSMGMIFMCSSETKKDCYRYKVLGLPAGKKDFVLKIYKGMRLFLFDVDLRMMYGIYKAAGPGGYNIEPKAFNSKFPSQVRFTVLQECVPLAEEKFKKVIKDNYYTKNKFNFQLTSVQVKHLCKLFHETTKRAESKQVNLNQIAPARSSAPRDRKRKRVENGRKAKPTTSSKRGRRRVEEEVRPRPVVIEDRHYHQPIYERKTYVPPTAPATLYLPLPARSPPRSSVYLYSRTAPRVDLYGRDSALEHREVGLSGLQEMRRPIELDRHDVYASFREPSRAYHEPAYQTGVRRDHYETGTRAVRYDYSVDGGRAGYYRSAEHRAPLPSFRRY